MEWLNERNGGRRNGIRMDWNDMNGADWIKMGVAKNERMNK